MVEHLRKSAHASFALWLRLAGARTVVLLALLAIQMLAPAVLLAAECPNKFWLYRKVGAATVLIFVRENNHGGSGVFVSPSVIATAKHILGNVTSPTLEVFHAKEIHPGQFDRGKQVQNLTHRIYVDDRLDLALVQVDIASLNFLKISTLLPAVNDPIIIVGHPDGLTWDLHDGVVTGHGTGKNVFLFSDPRLYFGNSGGPVCDCFGRITGLVLSMNPTKDRNEAVAALEIRRALGKFKPEVNYRVRPNLPNPRPVIINKRDGNNVVVTCQNVQAHTGLRYHLLHLYKTSAGRYGIFEHQGQKFVPVGNEDQFHFPGVFSQSETTEAYSLLIPEVYLNEVGNLLADARPQDDWPELLSRQGLVHCLDKTK